MKEISAVEEYIFEFIDKIRSLFVPEQWNNIFMDYSKNEIFALIFVYRKVQLPCPRLQSIFLFHLIH